MQVTLRHATLILGRVGTAINRLAEELQDTAELRLSIFLSADEAMQKVVSQGTYTGFLLERYKKLVELRADLRSLIGLANATNGITTKVAELNRVKALLQYYSAVLNAAKRNGEPPTKEQLDKQLAFFQAEREERGFGTRRTFFVISSVSFLLREKLKVDIETLLLEKERIVAQLEQKNAQIVVTLPVTVSATLKSLDLLIK